LNAAPRAASFEVSSMLRRVPIALALFLPAVVAWAQPAALTLEEALRRAETASPQARAIALEVTRARDAAAAAGLWENPDLSLQREEAGPTEDFATLSLRVPLWGRTSLERKAAEAGAAAAEAGAALERLRLRGAVRAAHLDLIAAQERATVIDSGRADLRDLVEALRHREREGESSSFDLNRAERDLAEVDADHEAALGRRGAARHLLAALLDLPPEGLVAAGSVAPPSRLPEPADLSARAAARGDVRELAALADSTGLEARALKRGVIPEPTFTYGRKTTDEVVDDDSGAVLGLSFALPIARRGQAARAAGSGSALLRARHEAALKRAEAEIAAAQANAAAALAAARVYAEGAHPEGLLRMARASYEAGEARILEVLDAYRTVLEVRLRRIDLDAAAARAAIDLDLAVGEEVTP
jgi:outer membrane protein, heavy metal efflux system